MNQIHRDTTTLLGKPQEDLEHWLRLGKSRFVACANSGVSYDTFRNWMAKGGDKSRSKHRLPDDLQIEPYYSFVQAIHAAEQVGKRFPRPIRNPTGPPPAPLSDPQKELAYHGFRQGWNSRAVASHMGVRHSTLLSWLHRGGYPNLQSAHVPLAPAFVVDPYKTFVEEVLRAEDAFFTGDF